MSLADSEGYKAKMQVHIAHCCARHGCKYGSDRCPVETGEYAQAHPCEQCQSEETDVSEQYTAKVWAVPSGYAGKIVQGETVQMVRADEHTRIVKALMRKMQDDAQYQYWEGRKAFKRDLDAIIRTRLQEYNMVTTTQVVLKAMDEIPTAPVPKYSVTVRAALVDAQDGHIVECSECGFVGYTTLGMADVDGISKEHVTRRHPNG